MEKGPEGGGFFFAEATEGINALLGECRLRFRHIYNNQRRDKPDPRTTYPYDYLNQRADNYEEWKEIVAGETRANLEDLTFLEFMAKLDREIQRREEKAKAAQKQRNEIEKQINNGRRKHHR